MRLGRIRALEVGRSSGSKFIDSAAASDCLLAARVFVEFQPVQGVSSLFHCIQLPRNYNPQSGQKRRKSLYLVHRACLFLQPMDTITRFRRPALATRGAAAIPTARSLVSLPKSLSDVNLEAGL